MTLAALLTDGAAALAIATGSRAGFALGVGLAHLAFWLDHVDGQVARWRGTASLDGVYFDYLMHHAASLGLGFGLGYGLAARTGDPRWAASGFAIALGWAGLSLHNDCRYKAFFQRLKRETGAFRVEGGRGGRPSPPAQWPRRGRAALTWPAFKACEPHVVLIGLTGLALVAIVAPECWLALWRGGVRLMAGMAPALAFGRAARAVIRRAVEAEFALWFQPWPDEPTPRHAESLTGSLPVFRCSHPQFRQKSRIFRGLHRRARSTAAPYLSRLVPEGYGESLATAPRNTARAGTCHPVSPEHRTPQPHSSDLADACQGGLRVYPLRHAPYDAQ